ncbi:glycogen operon protein [Curtobacterium luteum]|uniref:Glycogen operon protein n=1 Tax=Curtobacterium luteum TaxID=33881 RepID=A0A8H9KXH0_9MICO|nr:glycogen debranching enzyme [Curtobacterium luteum]MBM7801908.1 glycogen operon protein [Curtobacterium luteum]NUU51778.1 glycogen debranching enzyme [Curtobacterium luteum]GGK86723.1 glycogen operon protein GlgX homolog [Curtobacterium luteum]
MHETATDALPGIVLGDGGARFTVRSASATGITLVVAGRGAHPLRRVDESGDTWSAEVPGVRAGDRYHLLATGPAGPRHAFDAAAPLLDPAARGIVPVADAGAGVRWTSEVVDESFDWGDSVAPRTPLDRAVVYEANVRTLTAANPHVPEDLRGTYAGIAHESTIAHLHRIGVTTLELLPVHAFDTERWLRDAGRENAWGYNTLGFFAPHAAYASPAARAAGASAVLREFKGMVRILHEAGIQVVLDVVYNHTAEEGLGGPTTSLRGLDGAGRYRWAADADAYYDTTGCGNTLDTSVAATADLVVDSLRYWAREVRVDGFRFDLMVSLARDARHVFDPAHPLLTAIREHPDLQDVVVVAEPWDVGPDGWRTGSFGAGTSEWNDGFRNTVRQFWLTDIAEERRNGAPRTGIGALAGALTGSRHLFGAERGPLAGVNFVTAHDGFTLLDLVSYDRKHNDANGEENRDGSDDNRSFNHGIEGDTADRGVRAARGRSMRNLLGTLLLSAGVPMLTAGDERSRTQHGNNNAYVVSDDLTPVDWSDDEDAESTTATVAELTRLRAAHPALRPTRFGVEGQETPGASRMTWYGPDGGPMTVEGWDQPIHRALQYFVESTPEHEPYDRVLVVVHGSGRTRDITLPVREDVLGYRLAWSSEKHRDHQRLRPAGQVFTAYGPGIHVFEIA